LNGTGNKEVGGIASRAASIGNIMSNNTVNGWENSKRQRRWRLFKSFKMFKSFKTFVRKYAAQRPEMRNTKIRNPLFYLVPFVLQIHPFLRLERFERLELLERGARSV
jgi:hypothetical protein